MKSERGVISVFLSLLLSAMLFLDFALSDCTEVAATSLNLKYRNELALQSLLTDYDMYLKENYSLYGLSDMSADYMKAELYKYVEHNFQLYEISKTYKKISDFTIKSTELSKKESLADRSVFKTEIDTLMKYKMPENILETTLESLKEMGKTSEEKKFYDKYKDACSLIDDTQKCYSELYKKIKGSFESDTECAEGFSGEMLEFFRKSLSDCLFTDKVNDVTLKAAEIMSDYQIKYRGYYSEALYFAEELDQNGTNCENCANELEDLINSVESEELKNTIQKTIKELKDTASKVKKINVRRNLIAAIEKFDKLTEDTVKILSELQKAYSENVPADRIMIRTILDKEIPDIVTEFDIPENFTEISAQNIKITDKSNEMALALFTNSGSVVIEDELYKSLPSVTAGQKDDSGMQLPSFSGNNQDIDNDFSPENIVSFTGEDLLSSLYLDEYIMTYTKNSKNFSIKRYSFMNSEVEYIIVGNKSESENINGVKNRILGIRYLFNLAHVLTDSDKMDFARKAGDAMAASMSEGIGGPLYTAAIIASWTLAESVLDLDTILKGGKIPLAKTKETWKLDLESFGSIGNDEENDEESKGLDYEDYLRLLLLLEKYDTKLLRIQDLIELNVTKYGGSRYRLSETYTKLICTIKYEINLFVCGGKKHIYEITSEKSYY